MRFDLRPGVKRLFRLRPRSDAAARAEMDEELESLIASRIEYHVARGMAPDAARAEALARLGASIERTRATLHKSAERRERRLRIREHVENWLQDARYAVRGLRQRPGFAAAVVLTLALGIGANAAMFSIVDRLLFRPPARLIDPASVHRVYLWRTFDGKERPGSSFQYARYVDFARSTTSFSRIAAFFEPKVAVGTGDDAREMSVGAVSASFFKFFDAPPVVGRYFTAAEDSPPIGAPVAVLSYALWEQRYGARLDALNSTLQVGSATYTIIGVAPPDFAGVWNDPPAVYIPISTYAATSNVRLGKDIWYDTYHWTWLEVMVRRKPDVSVAAANADLTSAYRRSYLAQLATSPSSAKIEIARPRSTVEPILTARGPNASSVSKVATWVGGVALIVLLIACANVANLLVARALRRQREIAVRLALGVSRTRLLSQLLTESVMLALLGGVAGVAIAQLGGGLLRRFFFTSGDTGAPFHDGRTLAFAAVAALVAGAVTGLAPLLQFRRSDLTRDLKAGTREGTYRRGALRTSLLVLQGSLSVVLLVGAGLFVRSLVHVRTERLGYDVDPILIVSSNMRGTQLDTVQRRELQHRLLERARTVPGVRQASLQNTVPFWGSMNLAIYVAGIDSTDKLGEFDLNMVSPEYFATMGTRLLRGRALSDADRNGTPWVMVVSDAMANVLWPGKDPLGQCVRINADTMPCTYVVGVAENIRTQSLHSAAPGDRASLVTGNGDPGLFYYVPASQFKARDLGLFVRVSGDARAHIEPLRRALQQVMPGQGYVSVIPFSDIIGRVTKSWQLGATMFVAFGFLALVLAAIGLYSVIAYNVTQRTHEMGVRVALGAHVRDVVTLILGQGVRLSVIGILLGGAAALLAATWVQPLLFDVSARDPLIYGIVAALLLATAIAASIVPAWRAARVDPNVALRAE